MDTAGGLEVQMLMGAGLDETIAYLKSLKTDFALKGAEIIEANREYYLVFVETFETYFGLSNGGLIGRHTSKRINV